MNRFVLLTLCILLPLPGFSREFCLFPPGQKPAPHTTTPPGSHPAGERGDFRFRLFPPATGGERDRESWSVVDTSAPNQAGASQTPPKGNGTGVPHLVELSRANWRPLKPSEKFGLFWRDLLHWGTHASLAFDAGLSFVTGDRPYLGHGAKGYATRYGLNVADAANFTFFEAFLFPTAFHQDPRYLPLDSGTVAKRVAYAVSRVLVTRSDSGGDDINKSRILGAVIATSVSTVMYSNYGADIGVGGNFVAFGLNLATDAAFDVFKEFWPDVARKMKLNVWLRNLVRASIRDFVRVS
jgi:hypothetical protein